ncbi:MAG: iron-sulfur cluster assembly accessory protein [Gammaproteobacteria bacterium]|nr:iron-sulfur cluster assembly accessory protein [Gammaproteobacteria bacterium]
MAVSLTPAAAKRVANMLEKRGSGIGLRLGTRKSGCSGFAYVVDYADGIGELDRVFESHGVKIIVDTGGLPFIDGMEVDFVKTNGLNEGFEFNNPNVKNMCGCGESFTV